MAIKTDVTITFSKICALIIILLAGGLTFYTNNANIFVVGVASASAILANREYQHTKWMNKEEK